jgi:NAD(P)-dependent dehydrogenase (short-subunit alcohol dehydrogenase family)
MNGKVVWVTGANGGLGTSVTERFLAAGATLVGTSTRIRAADFPNANFLPLAADLTQPEAARAVMDSIIAKFGKLDALIHILGGFAGGTPVAGTDDATWQQMQNLNLNAAFYVFRAALPHLRKSGAGRIVAVGSLTAAQAHPNLGAYVVHKAALAVLVGTVALENADAGLTANAVLPGTMDTPGNRKSMPSQDFSKWLKTPDVAEVVFFLAGPQAGQINGATIALPGKG